MKRPGLVLSLLVCLLSPVLFGADKKAATQALLDAASQGDVKAMRSALDDGANPNAKDEDGNTPLMLISGESLMFSEERTIISDLIAKKAKVDEQNKTGMTALMFAARQDRTDNVVALLAGGAKPDLKDEDGWTAIMFASYNGNWGAFDKLAEAKASVDLEDRQGWTPMMLALSNGKGSIVERLQKAGVKVPAEFHGSSTLFYAIDSGDLASFRAALAAATDTAVTDSDGWTPLEYAAAVGQEQMMMDLLRAGADASIKDKEEKTALDRAVQYENTEIIALLGGEWKKAELKGTKIAVDCKAFAGNIESWVSLDDEDGLVVATIFPKPLSWYIGGGMTNRASTSKTMTYDGEVAGNIYLDVDDNAKTGSQPDVLYPGRKGAEYTLEHSEYGTTVTFRYRTSSGEERERPVEANVIDISVYKGEEMVDSEAWGDAYPVVRNQSGVLRSSVPLAGLGLAKGQKITVTTEFGKCISKPTVVTLK